MLFTWSLFKKLPRKVYSKSNSIVAKSKMFCRLSSTLRKYIDIFHLLQDELVTFNER